MTLGIFGTLHEIWPAGRMDSIGGAVVVYCNIGDPDHYNRRLTHGNTVSHLHPLFIYSTHQFIHSLH